MAGSGPREIAIDFDPTKTLGRKWTEMNKKLDALWSRFTSEIIPNYRRVPKWVSGDDYDLQPGDVVMVLDRKTRGVWTLAKVLETYPSTKDDRVRVAKVRLAGSHAELVLPARGLALILRADETMNPTGMK